VQIRKVIIIGTSMVVLLAFSALLFRWQFVRHRGQEIASTSRQFASDLWMLNDSLEKLVSMNTSDLQSANIDLAMVNALHEARTSLATFWQTTTLFSADDLPYGIASITHILEALDKIAAQNGLPAYVSDTQNRIRLLQYLEILNYCKACMDRLSHELAENGPLASMSNEILDMEYLLQQELARYSLPST